MGAANLASSSQGVVRQAERRVAMSREMNPAAPSMSRTYLVLIVAALVALIGIMPVIIGFGWSIRIARTCLAKAKSSLIHRLPVRGSSDRRMPRW